MKLLPNILAMTLFLAVGAAFAEDEEETSYTPGRVLSREQVKLVGPGTLDTVCIEEREGFKLDTGATRTGSIIVKRNDGEQIDVNVSIPLTLKRGYDEPVDPSVKQKADEVCSALLSAKGQSIVVILQEISEEDEGKVLPGYYLRALEIPGQSFKFQNGSEVYVKLPPKVTASQKKTVRLSR